MAPSGSLEDELKAVAVDGEVKVELDGEVDGEVEVEVDGERKPSTCSTRSFSAASLSGEWVIDKK